MNIIIKIISGILMFLCLCGSSAADPAPGDIFKEYAGMKKIDFFNGPYSHLDSVVTTLPVDDLDRAVKVELAFYYWGGHIGTSGQEFRINAGNRRKITQPVVPSGSPECYYRVVTGRSAVEVPLDDLREGSNTITFFCGDQICHGFNWPHYWIYNYIVRVYYEDGKRCQKGDMIRPAKGDVIGDYPDLELLAMSPDSIARVDFIAYYEGFDMDGDGVFTDWQYQVKGAEWTSTAGYATRSRFAAVWDNYWVPDQDHAIRFMARITDRNGYSYMTESVDQVSLIRKNRSVKRYSADDFPQAFAARNSQYRECNIHVPDDSPDPVTDARLYLSTWSADVDDDSPFHEIGINRQVIANKFGRFHDYSLDLLPVPVSTLRPVNKIHIHSTFRGHALEVNWPGPALLVERSKVPDDQLNRCRVDIESGEDPVVNFENTVFKACIRSHQGAACGVEHAIRDWIVKSRNVNQAVFYIDACAQRGPLKQARVLFERPDSAQIQLDYQDCKSGSVHAVSRYTFYRDSPFIRIDYLKYPKGWWNTVDIGKPGGQNTGVYKIYGMEDYPRNVSLYPDSYWNTYDPGYESDPKDGGVLHYKGYLIMLLGDLKSSTGFGRIIPVRTEESGGVKILKLLGRRGFETFPATGDGGKPYSSAIFVFDQGLEEAMKQAKAYIDHL